MCYQRDVDEETEEILKFKELYPDLPVDEEETVFKKPKPKVKQCASVYVAYFFIDLPHHAHTQSYIY